MTASRQVLLAGGAVGPVLFVGGFTALGAVRRGYDPRQRFVSDLARGPRSGLMRAVFVLSGLGVLAGAEGVRRTARAGTALPATLAVVGGGLALSGVFRTDGTDVSPRSAEGVVHGVLGAAVFTGLVVAPALSARSPVVPAPFRRASAIAAVGTGAGNVLLKATQLAPPLAGVRGLVQRAVLIAGLGWVSALHLALRWC